MVGDAALTERSIGPQDYGPLALQEQLRGGGRWEPFTYSGPAGSRRYFVYTPTGYTLDQRVPEQSSRNNPLSCCPTMDGNGPARLGQRLAIELRTAQHGGHRPGSQPAPPWGASPPHGLRANLGHGHATTGLPLRYAVGGRGEM